MVTATQAALLFYEGFDYPPRVELGDTIITSPPWENDKSQFTVAKGSLDYPGLEAPAGNRLDVASASPSLDSVRTASGTWEAQFGGSLYISFLLTVESAEGIGTTGGGTSVLTLGKSSNNAELLGINLLKNDGIKLGVLKYPSSSSQVSSAFFSSGPGANLSADGSVTYLIVAKYEWVGGATNDVVTVWVNPEGLGGTEDPANHVSTSAGADGTEAVGRLTLTRGPSLNIDEIRIGQKWADVTPKHASRQLAHDQ